MDVKLFEVRDSCTCMPVLCVRMTTTGRSHSTSTEKTRERKLLNRAGWPNVTDRGTLSSDEVILWALSDNPDEFIRIWNDRTRRTAHQWITGHWDDLKSGDLVDVRYILGETDSPCETDL